MAPCRRSLTSSMGSEPKPQLVGEPIVVWDRTVSPAPLRVFSGERRSPSGTIPSTTQRPAPPGAGLRARRSSLGLVVKGGEDFVGVLFRVVKSQAADREIDDFMTVPHSRPG
jgi:hypothetical protein